MNKKVTQVIKELIKIPEELIITIFMIKIIMNKDFKILLNNNINHHQVISMNTGKSKTKIMKLIN